MDKEPWSQIADCEIARFPKDHVVLEESFYGLFGSWIICGRPCVDRVGVGEF